MWPGALKQKRERHRNCKKGGNWGSELSPSFLLFYDQLFPPGRRRYPQHKEAHFLICRKRRPLASWGWLRGIRDRVHGKPLAQSLAQSKLSINVYFPVVTIGADEFIHRSLHGTLQNDTSLLHKDEVLLLFF